MKVKILTTFPELFPGFLGASLTGKALDEGKWSIEVINIRDYAFDKHGSVDDTPSGGGAGMVMRADVLGAALKANYTSGRLLNMSPRGKRFSQKLAHKFAKEDEITIICSRFEGIDERVLEAYNAEIDKAFAEKTIANRAEALHNAEAILMEDMPAIPVVFNESACLINEGLKLNNTTLWWENGSNYYVQDTLAWITVDNYDAYLVTCSNFLESKFDTYKTNSDSYFSSYEKFTWEEFKDENSNYAYLWKVYDITDK